MFGQILAHFSIKKKIFFLVFCAMAAVFIFALDLVLIEQKHIALAQKEVVKQDVVFSLMEVNVAAGNLIHEIQKERGKSAGFAKAKTDYFARGLKDQRALSDTALATFRMTVDGIDTYAVGEDFSAQVDEVQKILAEGVVKIRRGVDSGSLSVPQFVGDYTELNAELLKISKKTLFVIGDPELMRNLSAYHYLMLFKENAGLERAIGAAGFSGGWSPVLFSKFQQLIILQNVYEALFLSYATETETAFYAQSRGENSAFSDVDKIRGLVSKYMNEEVVELVNSSKWFEVITKKIDALKAVEDYIVKDVMDVAQRAKEAAIYKKNEDVQNRDTLLLILSLCVLFLGVLCIVLVGDIVRGFAYILESVSKVAKGDLSIDVSAADRKDEVGDVSAALLLLQEELREKVALEERAERESVLAREEKARAVQDMVHAFDQKIVSMIGDLAVASDELKVTAEGMKDIAKDASLSTQAVVSSTEQASANVSTVASAMEEMSISSNEIASQISSASARSNDTAENAKSANVTVSNLNQLVDNIGEVVIAIKDIAEQTNLLALNATIEAARAGDAGKGFAVVADEVKKLASETAHKTDEIEKRITEIQAATQNSVDAMERIISNISEIDTSVTGVSSAVEEQNATTGEIVRSVNEASAGVREVSEVIINVQKGATDVGQSSEAVLSAAQKVSDLSGNLKSSVEIFLKDLESDAVA